MDTTPLEWVNLVLRWTHVIAAIFWIGHAFLFNDIDHNLVPPEPGDPRDGLEGELWMVHGGGFYKVEKSWAWPTNLRGSLKWFRFEALFTWVSGALLLTVVFHMGGGVYLLNPDVPSVTQPVAIAISVTALIVGFVVYEAMCRSPLVRNGWLFGAVGWVFLVAAGYGLSLVLSGRAAFLHVGAMLGTAMVTNVWMVIIPTMRKMVAAVQGGGQLDVALGKKAKQRSLHNNYFVFPVIFLMISNHYPGLYGDEHGWVWLGAIVLVGAGIKHVMNLYGEIWGVYLATGIAVIGALALFVQGRIADRPVDEGPVAGVLVPIESTGTLTGTVGFEGEVPPPREVQLINCPQQDQGPAQLQNVRVSDGQLADVFVWVKSGVEGYEVPPAPAEPVVVDQRGCLYAPTVVGARVGQPIDFVNSDPVPHNVRTVAAANPTFNEMMIARDSRITKVFKKPEVMIEARCDIHPWMSAQLGVVAHPYFAVTGADGRFRIEGVPVGQVVLGAWHEVYGEQEVTVDLVRAEAGPAPVRFTFGP